MLERIRKRIYLCYLIVFQNSLDIFLEVPLLYGQEIYFIKFLGRIT